MLYNCHIYCISIHFTIQAPRPLQEFLKDAAAVDKDSEVWSKDLASYLAHAGGGSGGVGAGDVGGGRCWRGCLLRRREGRLASGK